MVEAVTVASKESLETYPFRVGNSLHIIEVLPIETIQTERLTLF